MPQLDTEPPRDAATTDDVAGEQATLQDYHATDTPRCEAYADSTGERCQRPALPAIPYCPDHRHLTDDTDLDLTDTA